MLSDVRRDQLKEIKKQAKELQNKIDILIACLEQDEKDEEKKDGINR